MGRPGRYPPEVRGCAGVRMVFSQGAEHESQWCAICSISAKLGMTSRSVDCVVTPSANNKGLHSETPAHIRLGGMMGVGVARPGWAVVLRLSR
jgi:hypothetical protein